MCKKLLLLLFWAIALSLGSAAQETLTVYDGTVTSSNVPIYGLYTDDSYLKCEYVIPAADLADMAGGNITQLTWYLNAAFTSGGWAGANFQIFLKEVDNATLDAYSGLDGATIVYEGAIDGDDTELTIEFATPYTYGGGNLLVGVYNTVKGTKYKAALFYGQTVTGASGQGKDGSSLDAVTFTQCDFIPKTTFTYTPSGPYYSKPKNLAVSGITTESANLTWEAGSTETAWNVGYKKQADEQWTEFSVSTTSATLADLDRATIYDVRVQADYGEGKLSYWTTTSFATAICDDADEGQISYELTDSYGDGWNGNAVNIVHHDSGIVIATLTIASGRSATGTVDLCYGETYDIVWVKGSYPAECSFVISDENGVIYEYAKTSTGPTAGVLSSFTWRRTTCKKPTALTAGEVAYNAATLTWTPGDEDQDNWQVAYGTGDDFDPDAEGITLLTANINPTLTLSNLAENTTYHAYVRSNCGEGDVSAWSDVCTFTTPEQFPTPTALTVTDIKARGATATWTGEAQSYTLRYRTPASYETFFFESFENGLGDWKAVDSDGDGLNWTVSPASSWTDSYGNSLQAKDGANFVYTLSYYGGALTPDQWLISPKVDLKGTLRYWLMDDGGYPETYRIYVSTTGTELDDFQPLTDDLQSPLDLAWTERSHDLSQFEGQQGYIAFRHYNCTDQDLMFLDAVGIYGDPVAEGEWTVIENATSPCNIAGLNPNTAYEVQVQANYAGGNSQWTDLVQFRTADENVMPTGLTVSDVKANSAKAQWTGVQDAYNLRYRSKAYTFFEDFEAGIPETWGNIDADGDTYNWYQFAPTNGTVDNVGNPTVLGTACATSASYAGSALTPDNWLVTPLVDLGGTLSVWLRGQDPSWAAEHFAIYVSTTGNTAEDFTTELVPETEATGVYVEYTADLSEYAGQQGYIAIRHFNCTDEFRLNVDNFAICDSEVSDGEWVTVQNVTSPYTITGLNGSTYYEVEVQGIVGDQTTEWTDAVVFKTAQGLRGDINGDGQVDVLDVNIAINITLNKDSAANYPGNADVNEDTIMDVADVNAIINIMLGKN